MEVEGTIEVRLIVGNRYAHDGVAEVTVEVEPNRDAAEEVLRAYLRNTTLGEIENDAGSVVDEILEAAL